MLQGLWTGASSDFGHFVMASIMVDDSHRDEVVVTDAALVFSLLRIS
jgi:hypothetical protein